MIRSSLFVSVTLALAALLDARSVRACGCFAQASTTSAPVVQAGERILFAHEGSQVIAYIQIQYQGAADQFGWLVPLPSVPTLELGTDELFTKLGATTQPSYTITYSNLCSGTRFSSTSGSGGCGFGSSASEAVGGPAAEDAGLASGDMGAMNPVVIKSSIGPYDFAVLKADDQSEMLKWLNDNRYFVPTGTDTAIKPYVHPGAYFLALKLRAGENAGDIVPIVLRYTSDLPMIPITLTSVGATPNMGILVWVLGSARAIPRNYSHTVLNDLPVWFGAQSYSSQMIKAIHEAPNNHSFITEYAGTSDVMAGQLDYPGRFGDLNLLRTIAMPGPYLHYLRDKGYPFDSTLFALLEVYLPEPPSLVQQGITQGDFYGNYDYFSRSESADGGAPTFDAAALTDAINQRIVGPTRKTAALFDAAPYLTRLYTNLSPADMNADPVFSENPDLPAVALVHTATLSTPCSGDPWLTTDQGLEAAYPGGQPPTVALPASLRIEALREAGPAMVSVDNQATIQHLLGPVSHGSGSAAATPSNATPTGTGCACDVGRQHTQLNLEVMLLAAGALLAVRRFQRRRRAGRQSD